MPIHSQNIDRAILDCIFFLYKDSNIFGLKRRPGAPELDAITYHLVRTSYGVFAPGGDLTAETEPTDDHWVCIGDDAYFNHHLDMCEHLRASCNRKQIKRIQILLRQIIKRRRQLRKMGLKRRRRLHSFLKRATKYNRSTMTLWALARAFGVRL